MIREGLVTLAGFVSLAWIQSAVWFVMFGTPFLVPHKVMHGEAFAAPAAPKLLDMLFSDRGGLFSTYPIAFVAVLGLPFMLRRARPWAVAAFIVLLLQWRVNASIFDWYQVRRFSGTIPLLTIGLVAFAPALARAGRIVPILIVLALHQYDVAVDALRPLPGRSVPVRAALREAADDTVATVYDGVSRVAPRVAVAFLDGYTGSTLRGEGRTELDFGRTDWWLRLPERPRRISDVEWEDGSLARFVDGREAVLTLPLEGEGELRLSFEIRALETPEPQQFEVLVNGRSVGRQRVAPVWETVRFIVPENVRREGSNEILLRFDQTANFFQLRGSGERVFRAAAIRRIVIHR